MIYLAPVLPEVTRKLASFLNIGYQNWSELEVHIQDTMISPYEHVLKRLVLEDVNQLLFDS